MTSSTRCRSGSAARSTSSPTTSERSSCRRSIKKPLRKYSRQPKINRAAINKGDHAMSQNHSTLSFPLKTATDAKALAEQLPPLMPGLFPVLDTIGRVHSSRFTILDEKTLLFLGDFDGELGELMADLAKAAGPLFDAIFQHVENPPATPVAKNTDAFVEWTAEHLLQAATLFSAYPDVTAKEIKALATAAGVTGTGKELPFLVILPIKSRLAYTEVQL